MSFHPTLPSDPMELGMVPFIVSEYWSDRIHSVRPNGANNPRKRPIRWGFQGGERYRPLTRNAQIKDGSIKVQDLAPELTFGNINGQASDGQIPTTIATDLELNAHINSATAHPASAITLVGPFSFSGGTEVQAVLKDVDLGLMNEVTNRRLKDDSLQSSVTTLQTATSDLNNIPGTLSETKIDSTIARDSEVTSAVSTHSGTNIATAHPSGTFPILRLDTDIATQGELDAEAAARVSGDTNDLTTTTGFGGDVSGAYNNIVITDDSHNHSGGTIADGTITSADIQDGTITTSDLAFNFTGWDTNASDDITTSGGTISGGDLTMSGRNIVMSGGQTVDGVDVSALGARVYGPLAADPLT